MNITLPEQNVIFVITTKIFYKVFHEYIPKLYKVNLCLSKKLKYRMRDQKRSMLGREKSILICGMHLCILYIWWDVNV